MEVALSKFFLINTFFLTLTSRANMFSAQGCPQRFFPVKCVEVGYTLQEKDYLETNF